MRDKDPSSKPTDKADAAELTTYSIRLNRMEKELLTSALQARGWTPTRFIHQAALEKAAQVHNTSRFTTFDFEGLARRLAKQLCQPEFLLYEDEVPYESAPFEKWAETTPGLQGLRPVTEPAQLTEGDVGTLRDAVKLGGSEFLQLLLTECERLVQPRESLPAPFDPDTLN